jgi:hypothetical protein
MVAAWSVERLLGRDAPVIANASGRTLERPGTRLNVWKADASHVHETPSPTCSTTPVRTITSSCAGSPDGASTKQSGSDGTRTRALKVSPASGSVADRVPTVVPDSWFSATVELESAMSVGALLATTKAVDPAGQLAGSATPFSVRAADDMSAQKYRGVFDGIVSCVPGPMHGPSRTEPSGFTQIVTGEATLNALASADSSEVLARRRDLSEAARTVRSRRTWRKPSLGCAGMRQIVFLRRINIGPRNRISEFVRATA